MDPQIEDDDFNPITDPEAIAKAREEQCDSHFTMEVLARLEVTEDPQVPQTLSDHSVDLMQKLACDLTENIQSMDDVMKVYQTIGMMDAYQQQLFGEAYEKHLRSDELAGEENREQKAKQPEPERVNDVQSKTLE